MMKFSAVVVLAVATSAFGVNIVTNPGFEAGNLNGWSTWMPSWCVGCTTTTDTGTKLSGSYSGRLQISNGQGSFGIKQIVTLPAQMPNPAHGNAMENVLSYVVDFSSWVRTGSNNVNWAEVMVFNYAAPDGDIDSGTISKPFCVWKRDSWTGYEGVPGGTLPTVATPPAGDLWEKVTKAAWSAMPGETYTIAFKWGRSGAGFSGSLRIDDVSLNVVPTFVPEPATMLLLGIPALLVRRRHA